MHSKYRQIIYEWQWVVHKVIALSHEDFKDDFVFLQQLLQALGIGIHLTPKWKRRSYHVSENQELKQNI